MSEIGKLRKLLVSAWKMGIDYRRTHRNSRAAIRPCYIYTVRASQAYFEVEAI